MRKVLFLLLITLTFGRMVQAEEKQTIGCSLYDSVYEPKADGDNNFVYSLRIASANIENNDSSTLPYQKFKFSVRDRNNLDNVAEIAFDYICDSGSFPLCTLTANLTTKITTIYPFAMSYNFDNELLDTSSNANAPQILIFPQLSRAIYYSDWSNSQSIKSYQGKKIYMNMPEIWFLQKCLKKDEE